MPQWALLSLAAAAPAARKVAGWPRRIQSFPNIYRNTKIINGYITCVNGTAARYGASYNLRKPMPHSVHPHGAIHKMSPVQTVAKTL